MAVRAVSEIFGRDVGLGDIIGKDEAGVLVFLGWPR